jgi:V8-like Glu-specific endopeptidase
MTSHPISRRQQRGWHMRWRIALLLVVTFNMAGICRAALPAGDIPAILEPLLITKTNPYDAEHRDIMPMTTSRPWGAVGFLDNGCTSTLIDSRHILAASHCFTFDYDGHEASGAAYLQGGWQRGLVFFPNYHPSRPNPPRVQVDRVIVGSRVQDGSTAPADWGIGHLTSAVTSFPSLAMRPMEHWRYPDFVSFAGYARDAATYPKGAASYPQPSPGGYCANFGGNCWWIPAFVDPRCLAIEENDGSIRLDNFSCPIQGGNSGSPVVWNTGSAKAPNWKLTGVISGGGGFWNATRFQYAPRYAADIAVATYDTNPKRSQVFAIDSDLSKVVSRYRSDTSSTGMFTYFRDLGGVSKPRAIAAIEQTNGKPIVFVAGTGKSISVKYVSGSAWKGWKAVAGPGAISSIRDISVAPDKNGVPYLYLIGNDYKLYTSHVSVTSSGVSLGTWTSINTGAQVKRISATRHGDGRQQLFFLTTTGELRSTWQNATTPGATWSNPSVFSSGSVAKLVDVSAGWTANGHVQVFAVDSKGNSWSRSSKGTSPSSGWNAWSSWSVPRYAPKAATPPKLDGVIALSASRWRENSTNTIPVVFALDDQGNIYVTTYQSGGWKPWISFYN